MKSPAWLTCLALLMASGASAALKPVAFRLASLPNGVAPGQKLVLCAANIGTGALDVTLEFLNVTTGAVVAEKTVTLQPLGAGTGAAPCVTMTAESSVGAAANTNTPVASSFAAAPAAGVLGEQALVVGVAMVRKPLISFREAQVTASIQVMAPDANGELRTVETIPLSRTAHPADGAPVYAPAPAESGHHK
jgi:hypothetical protein